VGSLFLHTEKPNKKRKKEKKKKNLARKKRKEKNVKPGVLGYYLELVKKRKKIEGFFFVFFLVHGLSSNQSLF